jgi:predicted ATP-grasp superfamily ATP-dependent carboligase
MHAEPSTLLLVAITGRALVESAARSGRGSVVLDCFADRDTRALATRCKAVGAAGAIRFEARTLLAAAEALSPPARSEGLVYGSGFEARPALLARLARGRRLLGNAPAVVAAVKHPHRFFPLLDRLGIPHPEVRDVVPANDGLWLVKQVGGAGGTHVAPAPAGTRRRGAYVQRCAPGEPHSVLFLADGRRAVILGFNRQWLAEPQGRRRFLYGGAVGRVEMPSAVAAEIGTALDALVAATGLVGLNGLDFLLRGDGWSVLEVNPRPTATIDLYDADVPRGLLDWHIRAVGGELPDDPFPSGPARAHLIVRAERPWRIPARLRFPVWCRDIPLTGQEFVMGDPVCTVHAAAGSPDEAVRLVRARERAFARLLIPGRRPAVANT